MRATSLAKDHLPSMILNVLAMLLSSVFLHAVGISGGVLIILLIVWVVALLIYYGFSIYRTRKRTLALLELAENLDKKYLLAEIISEPGSATEVVYHKLLKMAGKSMMEQVGAANCESHEYREYVEQWIHDIKTPISGIRLLCDNNKSEWTRTLLAELEKIDHLVGQAVYYARSENTAKDYIVRETIVNEMVHAAILENKQMLLNNGVHINLVESALSVFTDRKWIEFILGQLIINAVQYRRDDEPAISFTVKEHTGSVSLTVRDNGIGMSQRFWRTRTLALFQMKS